MKKTNEDLDWRLAAFRRGTLEDFFTLSSFLKSEDISVGELKEYLEWKARQVVENKLKLEQRNREKTKAAREQFAEWERKTRRCPDCGSILGLTRITTPKGKANQEGWRSLWSCTGEDCQFEEYTREFTDKIYTEIMEG